MNIAVTGTPGTGKTTAVKQVSTTLEVVHLNTLIESEGIYTTRDQQRDSVVADIDALIDRFADQDGLLIESHLAHYLPVDRVVVLRCHPATLEQRLQQRGESAASAAENAESEALDVILTEAVDEHGTEAVFEIDTTDRSPAAVAAEIEAVIDGTRSPSAGTVSYMDYLMDDDA